MDDILVTIIVPVSICVVLPVSIVALRAWQSVNNANKRAQILLKAIEANNNIDADKLAEALGKPKKSARQTLFTRLLWGCILTLAGIALEVYAAVIACLNEKAVLTGDEFTDPALFGALALAIGISLLIVYFVTRKHILNKDSRD